MLVTYCSCLIAISSLVSASAAVTGRVVTSVSRACMRQSLAFCMTLGGLTASIARSISISRAIGSVSIAVAVAVTITVASCLVKCFTCATELLANAF